MAYADYDFYRSEFCGDALKTPAASRWLEAASDELDALTFGRLETAFPQEARHAAKIKKAVCAIAEALYFIDAQRRAAIAQKGEDGSYRGAVASVSSGKESISFASVSGSAAASAYAAAAASPAAERALIGEIAAKYLARIPDANGVNLLYAGGVGHVPRHNNGL